MRMFKIIAITIIAFLGALCIANAQDVRTTLFAYSDANATVKDGFNIGSGIDYQRRVMYTKAQIFYFPNLREYNYLEVTATGLGFNKHLGMFNKHRIYTGFKMGMIFREGHPYPTVGIEGGYEVYLKKFFIGLMASRDYRCDGQLYDSNLPAFWRNSVFLKFGFEI